MDKITTLLETDGSVKDRLLVGHFDLKRSTMRGEEREGREEGGEGRGTQNNEAHPESYSILITHALTSTFMCIFHRLQSENTHSTRLM